MARQTKADRILNDAAMRLEAARLRERTAQSELNTARATLAVLQEAYDSPERELAPKPRKKAAQSQSAQATLPTDKKAEAAKPDAPKSNGQLCIAKIPGLGVECGDPEENKVHDKNAGYAGYHPFEAPAQTAGKRSRRKEAHTLSVPNSEIEKSAALSASGD